MHKAYTFVPPAEYYIEKSPELLFIQYDENIQGFSGVIKAVRHVNTKKRLVTTINSSHFE